MKNPFRKTSRDPSVQRLYAVWEALHAQRVVRTPWSAIGAVFPGVPPATLCAIYKHGREPKKAQTRAALGLPLLAPAPVCAVHGIVHLHPCPAIKRPKSKKPRPSYKKLAEAYQQLYLISWAVWSKEQAAIDREFPWQVQATRPRPRPSRRSAPG